MTRKRIAVYRIAVLLLIGVAIKATAETPAAPPDADLARRLVLASLPPAAGELKAVTVAPCVPGANDQSSVTVASLDWGYYQEVFVVAFAMTGDEWTVVGKGDSIMFIPELGDDPGSLLRLTVGPDVYYAFTCSESSAGSGMTSDYDHLIFYRFDGRELGVCFEGDTRVSEVYFARWYGGDDSTAWVDGGEYAEKTRYSFDDGDADGRYELWTVTEKEDPPGTPAGLEVRLYARNENGVFEQNDEVLAAYLASSPSAPAYAAAALVALEKKGDVATATEYYKNAAQAEPEWLSYLQPQIELLQRLGGDPSDAVRMYFTSDWDNLKRTFPESWCGFDAVLETGDLRAIARLVEKREGDERWTTAYGLAAAEAAYETHKEQVDKKTLALLKQKWEKYREREKDAETRAKTATRVADAFRYAGDNKTAEDFYKLSLRENPSSVFADYNLYRLGEAAEIRGDTPAALDLYLECIEKDGWWSYAAWESCANYCTLTQNGARRNFLDSLHEASPGAETAFLWGELDGAPGADLVVIAREEEGPGRLFYFFRRGEEFLGTEVAAEEGRLVNGAIYNDAGRPGFLAVEYELAAGTKTSYFEKVYRYDGAAMRPVAEIPTGEISDGGVSPATRVEYIAADPPALRVVIARQGEEETERWLRWDAAAFSFVPGETLPLPPPGKEEH